MAELIWVQDDEAPTEYADRGKFRASVTRGDQPAEGRVTIRYFIRDLETGSDEKASYLQVPAARVESAIASLRVKLEAELIARVPSDDEP